MKKYADDYETVITTDENGEEKRSAVYRGTYFEFDLDEEGVLHLKRNSLLLLAAIVILHIGGGFVDNRGMYQFFVALPYVLAFFPLLYLGMGVLRLPKQKRPYRRDEIGLSFGRMKTASLALALFLGIGLLGEIIFLLFLSEGNQGGLEALYLGLEMVATFAVIFFIRLQRQIRILTCSNEQK